ncbi:MAG TPA: hypothetical protein VE733_22710 [Streptosporangiaceae bacterium]|nr:hypothetical protein [Streptosporangiaceae bacterium]
MGTVRRSWRSVLSQDTSAAVSFPWLTAATTGTAVRFVMPNGAASCDACSLGALVGRKLALLPCVTLASDGRKRGYGNRRRNPGNNDHPAKFYRKGTQLP